MGFVSAPGLRKPDADQALAQIVAIDLDPRNDAAVSVAPPSGNGLDPTRLRNPLGDVGARGLGQSALLGALGAGSPFRRINVFNAVPL